MFTNHCASSRFDSPQDALFWSVGSKSKNSPQRAPDVVAKSERDLFKALKQGLKQSEEEIEENGSRIDRELLKNVLIDCVQAIPAF